MLQIENIYRFLAVRKGFRFFFSFFSFLYRSFTVEKIRKEYLQNIEGVREMDIIDFEKKRKKWISGVLRTRDGWDFLEKVVTSFIDDIDELIIVNNNSTDNTSEVCKKLIQKYGNKISYYEYKYDILRELNKPTNSLHSFAYYSNWSISKASYKTILKVDDDNLFIPELFKKQVVKTKKILSVSRKVFCFYWGLNFYWKEGKIWVLEKNPYSWRFGDIWFFNISPKTYFVQEWISEKLINNYFYYDLWFSYIHMKYFKKNNWLKYSPKKNIIYYQELLKESELVDVGVYTKRTSQWVVNNLIIS